jgi:release factor H-coupled RctB family protein
MKIDDNNVWLHRKGAAPADEGPMMIPGSRGTLSYLEPVSK